MTYSQSSCLTVGASQGFSVVVETHGGVVVSQGAGVVAPQSSGLAVVGTVTSPHGKLPPQGTRIITSRIITGAGVVVVVVVGAKVVVPHKISRSILYIF